MNNRIIAAVSLNGVIGVDGVLPWRLKDDLRHFNKITQGRAIVMGGNTYRSLPCKLEGRKVFVLSKTLPPSLDYELLRNPNDLLYLLARQDCDVVGGQQIYEIALEAGYVSSMVITNVKTFVPFNKDSKVAFFPYSMIASFVPLNNETKFQCNKDNSHSFNIVTYKRI